MHLSGTPFKALANNKFNENQIFNWSYVDEQRAKTEELASGDESASHTDMPDLRLFTYRLSDMIADKVNQGMNDGEETLDFTFDLNEFFATKNNTFVHESDIIKFLDALATNQKYPFSTPELRAELKHTFWLVGNRVSSAKALEKLLRKHPDFQEYEVILAAGDGKRLTDDNDFEDEAENTVQNEKAFDRVRKAIKQHDKTITLSVGQLTTGVTIPEWSAVLMLSDINTPSLYMQSAFRAQNPYKFYQNGYLQRKKSAYIFDFAPTRVLTIFDDFANSLLAATANGQATVAERTENVATLLNFFPVISEDRDGKMIELDASQVLTFPKSIKAQAIVNSGFISNLLFTNISNIFSIPREVIDTLEKMDIEHNKRNRKATESIDRDKLRQDGEMVINQNTKAVFGDKIYRDEIMDIVETANYNNATDQLTDMVNSQVMEPIYTKYKEFYQSSDKEVNDAKKYITEKVQNVVDEYNNLPPESRDTTALASDITNIIEQDAPDKMVIQKEESRIATEQATEEDKVRGHLRAFARTIPSFIMANSHPESLTIDNLTDDITDEDFENLTSITKLEFERLRDGFDYVEDGQVKHFDGLFDKFIFNASIQEFEAKRQQLANYFQSDQTEDIFDYIPPQKTNQIFTPRALVQKQLDLLEQETPNIFTDPSTTFADLYIKSGLYITETVKRLFAGLAPQIPDETARLKHILEHQVYGFAPTQIIHDIATNFIFGELPGSISRQNFKHHDLTKQFEKGEQLDMKFDVIIGNPPYQQNDNGKRDDGSANASASPIYHYFVNHAIKMSQVQCFVIPARWTVGAGKGLSKFTEQMLADEHIKSFNYFSDSKEVFPNNDIKGGICYFVRDTAYSGEANISVKTNEGTNSSKRFLDSENSGVFIPFGELADILHRVKTHTPNLADENMQKIVSVLKPYGLRTDFFHLPAKYNLPDVYEERNNPDDLEIFGLYQTKRTSRFVPKDYPVPVGNHTIGKWKVFLPYAYGCGAIGETIPTPILGSPILGSPIQICTETYLRIGAFNTKEEAEALLKYIKTKFFRVMVGILKTTQHSTTTYRLVPLQNFTANSDIDWTKSIPEIDQQLYRKYNLDQHEIDFIEEKVKEMKWQNRKKRLKYTPLMMI